jgi:hypothetical protein
MKRLITLLATVVVAIAMSGMASAQGKKGGGGKPATTGLEHAEGTANANGQRGIDNAEAKQAEHKDPDKGKAKGKQKKHKKHNQSH